MIVIASRGAKARDDELEQFGTADQSAGDVKTPGDDRET